MEILESLLRNRSVNSTIEVALLWREFNMGTDRLLLPYLHLTKDEKHIYIVITKEELDKQLNLFNIVVNWLRNNFPNKRYNISDEQVDKMFYSLQQYKPIWLSTYFDIVNMGRKGNINLFDDGKPRLLLNLYSYYIDFNLLTEYFMDLERLKVKRKDTKQSPLNEYKNNTKKFVVACLNERSKIDVYLLRETIWKLTHEATEFKCNIMCSMIDFFSAKRVIDFSAGRGARLIGCIARNVDYVGIDPDTDLRDGYNEIINRLGKQNHNKYVVIEGKAQDKSIYKNIRGKFDLCFSSPPYFDLEDYSNDKTQSIVEFNTVDKWIAGFLIPSVENIMSVMEIGGNIAININDPGKNVPKRDLYTQKMIDILNKDNRLKYRGVIGYAEGTKDKLRPAQPIWVWRYLG